LALLLTACGDPSPAPSVGPPLPGPVPGALADPARDARAAPPGAIAFYAGLYADTVGGDPAVAGDGYERALADPALPATLGTRAALRWAALEATAGRTRRAIELVARASAIAEGDPVLTDSADRLQGAIASLGPTEVEVRGPPLGTAVAGADAATAARLTRAEDLLARAHRLRLRPVIEALSSSIRAKEQATEAAARAFRDVADAGPAAIAADYRIGSLYHDLAIALVFELPPELDPGVASRLRRTLRANALGYLRKAVTAYRRALDQPPVAGGGDPSVSAGGAGAASPRGIELWLAAAQSDLRGALDLLGEP
jgi:hypothetical protein